MVVGEHYATSTSAILESSEDEWNRTVGHRHSGPKTCNEVTVCFVKWTRLQKIKKKAEIIDIM